MRNKLIWQESPLPANKHLANVRKVKPKEDFSWILNKEKVSEIVDLEKWEIKEDYIRRLADYMKQIPNMTCHVWLHYRHLKKKDSRKSALPFFKAKMYCHYPSCKVKHNLQITYCRLVKKIHEKNFLNVIWALNLIKLSKTKFL